MNLYSRRLEKHSYICFYGLDKIIEALVHGFERNLIKVIKTLRWTIVENEKHKEAEKYRLFASFLTEKTR